MNRALLQQWQEFCKSPNRATADEFYTLLMGPTTVEEIDAVVEYVEQGERLGPRLARLKRVAGASTPLEGEDRLARLEEVAEQMLAEKERLLRRINKKDLLEILDGLQTRWVSLDEFIEVNASSKTWPKGEMLSVLGDYFRNVMGDYSLVVSALMEAIYGFTKDYDLVWYVLKPYIELDFDAEPVAVLRENGIQYTITEDHLILCDFTQAS